MISKQSYNYSKFHQHASSPSGHEIPTITPIQPTILPPNTISPINFGMDLSIKTPSQSNNVAANHHRNILLHPQSSTRHDSSHRDVARLIPDYITLEEREDISYIFITTSLQFLLEHTYIPLLWTELAGCVFITPSPLADMDVFHYLCLVKPTM